MKTFAERLKMAINKRGISQAEAARLSGISQQSINYIVNNDLKSSKLAPQIASSLGINPEWLIFGRGKFESHVIYELPILHSPYMLKKFLENKLEEQTKEYTVTNVYLGTSAFAYLIEPKKMLICSTQNMTHEKDIQFLTFNGQTVMITETPMESSFPIFEWRTRNVDF